MNPNNNDFDFDLGLKSGRSKPLNEKKNPTSSYSSSTTTPYNYSSGPQKPNTTSSWSHQPNKPAWTHQPAAPVQSGSLSGPTSMVGDIHGKSWNSTAPTSNIGIVNSKNPNLFSDLLGSAMSQNKSSGNVPLKKAGPASSQSSFSMGGVADSLPNSGYSGKGSGGNVGYGGSGSQSSGLGSGFSSLGGNGNGNRNLGGAPLKSMGGSGGGGVGMMGGVKKDPFVSLVDFGSKPNSGINTASKESVKSDFGSDFGEFQNAASNKTSPSFPSDAFPAKNSDPMDDFGFGNSQQNQPSGGNEFDVLFSSASVGGAVKGNEGFSGTDHWGSEFVGGDDSGSGGGTTELEGLPPPPAGVTSSSAKNKGVENYKQGQYADAIKWLSWAVVLLEKARDDDGSTEVLTCRASCYKEVGEYKKAVADCTKVLDHDSTNVSVLVQRALLYESMEKYKLGAEDLRTVMKLDPGNRVARSTVHRLTKMAAQ